MTRDSQAGKENRDALLCHAELDTVSIFKDKHCTLWEQWTTAFAGVKKGFDSLLPIHVVRPRGDKSQLASNVIVFRT
ncbi:MAG: hypothetical protein ACPF80_06400 [Flavobacteriaceae bacterium]